MDIIIINGPNLNLLGKRQPEIYGSTSFEMYFEQELLPAFEGKGNLLYFQSNHEGKIIDLLHDFGFAVQGIILNAGAFTHYSYAIADAIAAIESPVVEVHISNILEREDFRKVSVIEPNCVKTIMGKGLPGYQEAIDFICQST